MADILIDNIPVQPEDKSTWLERFSAFIKGGGPWGTAKPGQRGAWVPSQINAQGRPEWAVPEYVENAADVAANLPRVGFSEIMRDPDGNRDIIRRLAEGSFDLAGMLPAAGAAIGRTVPNNAAGISGHDGMIARNVQDPPSPTTNVAPSDVFQAFKRGTVYDANGELIFSNSNDPTTAAILAILAAQQGGQQQQ